MVHPTRVGDVRNNKIRMKIVEPVRNEYIFAFSHHTYGDFNIYNKLHEPTEATSGFLDGFKTLFHSPTKPVVFLMTYDIGQKKDVFVRHVITCIATRVHDTIHVIVFDMRNLRQIDAHHKEFIEKELRDATHMPSQLKLEITNGACLERKACVYLQRFKHKHDIGWCIAWSMLFLEAAIARPVLDGKYAYQLSFEEQKRAFAELYRLIDAELRETHSNKFIEVWYEDLLSN